MDTILADVRCLSLFPVVVCIGTLLLAILIHCQLLDCHAGLPASTDFENHLVRWIGHSLESTRVQ